MKYGGMSFHFRFIPLMEPDSVQSECKSVILNHMIIKRQREENPGLPATLSKINQQPDGAGLSVTYLAVREERCHEKIGASELSISQEPPL